MGELELVCFDLGGVVIRICRSWEEGCAAAGLPVRDPALWQSTRPARRELVLEHQTGRIDGPTFATRASALVGGLYSPAEILRVHRAWMTDEYEGIGELVDQLHAAGLKTAALSNTNDEHWSRIVEFPAVSRMQYLLASHQLGLHKPDRAIYERVEQSTGCTGGQILFFDDTADNVKAAKAIGWHAEIIDHAGDPVRQIRTSVREFGFDV